MLLAALSSLAMAQETVDLGTLRNDEIRVVQKVLYPKADRTEVGFQLGATAFDPYMKAPKIQITAAKHQSETLAYEVQVGAGYGIGTNVYRELGSAAYGVRPEAYRYLGSVTAGVTWSPIYAKMNYQGQRVFHHDIYIPIVGGVTVEQLAWGEKYLAFSPTVGIGVGARVFQNDGMAIRIELRDDILAQNRKQSGTLAIKQNVGIHVGVTKFGDKK
jgi:outer membrane beta-barrel protein